MKTTPIGSFRLVMIRARKSLLALSALWCACLMSCQSHDNHLQISVESDINYGCQKDCELSSANKLFDLPVHLEVEPVGQMPQVFYHVKPKSLVSNPIVLRQIIHINGSAASATVHLATTNCQGLEASSAFTDIVATPIVNRNGLLSPPIQTIKSHLTSAGYQLELEKGLAYILILNPSGACGRPPIIINTGILAMDKQLDFPTSNAVIKGQGRVVSNQPFLFANADKALMRVSLTQGPRLISSIAEVDKHGDFSLEVASPLYSDLHDQPIALIIEPIDFDSPLPRIKQKISYPTLKKDFDLGAINLGDLETPFPATIEIVGADKSNIGNAFLYLSAKIGAGLTQIRKDTDFSGTITFNELYDGHYDIAIVPPFDSEFGMRLIKDVEFDENLNSKILIELNRRKKLNATIVSSAKSTLSGAQIELLRIGELGNLASEDIYEDRLFKLTAVTNEDGRVCHRKFGFSTSDKNDCDGLLLDDGRYLAHVIPPAGTEMAHKWITFDFPKEDHLEIVLDQPQVLMGQIVGSVGQAPIKNAFITVYLADSETHNQAKIIGNAITDDHGFFRAFVASP